jgi:cysteine dioxygenase
MAGESDDAAPAKIPRIAEPDQSDDVARAKIPPQLEVLVRQLKEAFGAATHVPSSGPLLLPPVEPLAIASHLQKYAASARERFSEWSKYLHWNDVHYTRNLVYSCDDFELIVLCWGPGHASRIHNHDKSHCWMAVLSGMLTEQLYQPAVIQSDSTLQLSTEAEKPADTSASASCPLLLLLREAVRREGDVAYVNDAMSLHRVANSHVSNRNSQDQPAAPVLTPGGVTLHLYAPPIRRVKIYEPGESKVYVRTPGYYSVHGDRQQV